jgi:hypothetical protein
MIPTLVDPEVFASRLDQAMKDLKTFHEVVDHLNETFDKNPERSSSFDFDNTAPISSDDVTAVHMTVMFLENAEKVIQSTNHAFSIHDKESGARIEVSSEINKAFYDVQEARQKVQNIRLGIEKRQSQLETSSQ